MSSERAESAANPQSPKGYPLEKPYKEIDFCDPKTHDDAYEMYDHFLEHEPLAWDPHNELWQVFRYDDIVRIERDPETFCSGEGVRPNLPPDPGMIYQDGEQHTKQRALVSQGFTPRQMRKMEDRVQMLVDEMVGEMLKKDECDIVEDIACKLPMELIADMLDIPHEKRDAVRSWIEGIMAGGQGPQYVSEEVNDAFGNFADHHMEMVADREAKGCPGQDLLTIWMNAELKGEKLDESQLLFEHVLLNVGGAETTRSAIAGGLERLSAHPDQYDALYENPALIPNAVEEIIRWVCPFVNMYRTATRDYEIHGKVIKAGEKVGLNYPAANRDPRHFKDPHAFDIHRDFNNENSKHLAFGLGPHFCLGSSLARLETRTVIEVMTQKVKRVVIPEGKSLEYVSSSFVRGLSFFPAILEVR